ncbi:MAG: adenylate cyclase, partial [Deltaproteobacteria bacterium]|nr:adenylate cyclase [Deltaproteobacteria bacterium]
PYHQNSALYPIIDQMQRRLQFAREDAPAAKLEKLPHQLRSYHFPQADTVALLAAFLSLPHPVGAPALTLSPQKQKQKTQEALVAWIVEEAERVPVYCAWEDLHRADPSTLELLTLYLDQVPTTRQLALLTFRSDFMPPWSLRSYFMSLTLSRLGRQQVETMVAQVTGGKALPVEVVEQIVSRTDGVPLFVEELTKTVLESVESMGSQSSKALQTIPIPTTLHESLMARLDRLGPAKEVVQLGAALGREFSYELLQAVSPKEETPLQQALAKLVEAEVLYQRGAPPQTRYLFKHALIQDAAYQSLLKRKRHQYHQQIAQVLEERFPETKETQPELIAYHYTEAGEAARAVPAWQKAGQRAIEQSAFAEATAYWNKGLTVLNTLPETPDRDQQELQLHAMLGPTLAALKGYAAPDVERTYARALELCRRVGETPRFSQVLLGLAIFYLTRGELQTARQLGEQCLALAQQGNNPSRRLQAEVVLANILFYQGEFAQVEEHLLEGMTLYTTRPPQGPLRTLQDPGINALSSLLAWTLWCRGYPDRAAQNSEESMLLAERSERPLSQVIASVFACGLRTLRREEAAAFRYAEQAVSLATEQQFSLWTAYGTILRGWVLGQQADPEAGIAQIHQGLAMAKAMGADLVRSWFLLMLAETYGKTGKVAAGLATIAEALEVVQKSGELPFAAEVHRMKGELRLRRSEVRGPESEVQENQKSKSKGQKAEVTDLRPLTLAPRGEAESCFLKAIDLARTQHAKSWELRASTSLARLWQRQGQKAEAHKLL